MLSENDGSGMDFFKKLRTALINAALCGKHLFFSTAPTVEPGPATDNAICTAPFSGSFTSTSILLSSELALLVKGCSVSMGTSSVGCDWEEPDWAPCVSLVSMALLSCWLDWGVGRSGDKIPPWYGLHFFISCCDWKVTTTTLNQQSAVKSFIFIHLKPIHSWQCQVQNWQMFQNYKQGKFEITNSTTVKYSSTAFQWLVTF